jgi:PAS domain S-box-containing protein
MLDMRTLFFIFVVTNLVCILVIVHLWWWQMRNRFAGQGTAFWVFGFVCLMTALLLILLHGNIPNWISMVLANTLLISGALLGYMGLERFIGEKSSQIHNYILLAVFTFVHAYFTFVQPNQSARNLNLSVGLLIICFQCMWLMLYKVESGMRQLTRGVGFVFGAYCLVTIVRAVGFFTGAHSQNDYLHSGIFEQLVLISYQILFILLTYNLTLMSNKRLLLEITTQEEKFSKAFHLSPYAIILTRLSDGQIIEANDGFLNITGYQYAEINGKTMIDLLLWAGEEDYIAIIDELALKGRVQDREVQFRKKSAEMLTVLLSAEIITTDNEKCVLSTINDITESKRMVDTLRKSEGKYRELADFLPQIVFETDTKGNLTFVNHAALAMSGYTQADIETGMNVSQIIIPEDLDKVQSNMQRILSEGRDLVMGNEYTFLRKDGTTFPIKSYTNLITNDNKLSGLRGFAIDISDIKIAEEALRKSENRYRAIFENTGAATVILEEDTTISLANKEFEKLVGYTRDEIEGKKSWTEFVFKEDLDRMLTQHHLRMVDAAAAQKTYEFRLVDRNGRIKHVDLTIDLISGQKKSVASLLDITERKLLESQLRQAQKMEAIGTLAGGIAHDFNNILSAIMGYTDMALSDSQVKEPLRRYLTQVFKGGECARDLVKQILTFSRQTDEELRPLMIGPSVKEVLKLLRSTLPSTIKITQDIRADLDTVLADSTQVHQILMNLCTNAVHAMREKKGELKVSLVSAEIKPDDPLVSLHGLTSGMYIKLTVSDTGSGIAPEILGRIFDPFFTTKRPEEGTGMGLSIVYGIVKKCYGAITVESEVGKGADFHVYLPLLKETGENQEVEEKVNITGGKERILFVDDEEVLVQLGKEMLTDLGYEVIEKTSSLEALELFRSRPNWFDIVITDMTMPNMTGLELALELMRIQPGIPVIICTGFSAGITPKKAKAMGIKELIMKPIIQRQIAAAIRRAIN